MMKDDIVLICEILIYSRFTVSLPFGPEAAEIEDFGEETKVLNHFYYDSKHIKKKDETPS